MSAGAYENDGDAVIEMDLLPPRWIDVQDEVDEALKAITLQAAKLDKLHSKHVLPGFDDESVKQQEEREIEHLTRQITRGFQECQKSIKRIETMVRDAKQTGNLQKGDEVMASNIQVALASRVQEVSATFRKKQSTYLNSGFSHCTLFQGFGSLTRNRTSCSGRLRISYRPIFHTSAESLL